MRLVTALAALVLTERAATAEPDLLAAQEQQQVKLFSKVAPAVIFIGDQRSLGTGFFVSTDGLALTAAHVVDGKNDVSIVLHGGKRTRASVIARRADLDLALLQVTLQQPSPSLPLAVALDMRVGQWAGAVGHGLGGVWAFTTGMVSNLYESDHGAQIVQTQIPLNPGNSGGPIFDRMGRVVAVVSKGATNGNSINLGVHISDALDAFDQLLPMCDCLAIDVPDAAGTAVFVDDKLAGKGPRVLVRPTPGLHSVSAVIGGAQVEKTIRYPADRRIVLRGR